MNVIKKGGRPKKADAEKLKYRVNVKLCTKDFLKLKSDAETAGMSMTELARQAICKCKIKARLTPEQAGWIRQLSGMANNLNQLARHANSNGHADLRNANINLGSDIYELIKLIRDDRKHNKR